MKYVARVVPGRGEGKKLGVPTINLEIPEGFAAENEFGIYTGAAWIKNGEATEKHPAAIHYGPVPVFDVLTASLEIHIIDADIPSAPQELTFEAVKYLRKIRPFGNIEALKEQMQADIRQAREEYN